LDFDRSVVEFGIAGNGFYLWGPIPQHASAKPVIESDRVEGTAVFDLRGHRIGAIKRLLIEKVSGRVIYVDVTFGGFLGVGVHHRTLPLDKLTYDTRLNGYRTDITAQQVRGAPAFYGDNEGLVLDVDRRCRPGWPCFHPGRLNGGLDLRPVGGPPQDFRSDGLGKLGPQAEKATAPSANRWPIPARHESGSRGMKNRQEAPSRSVFMEQS